MLPIMLIILLVVCLGYQGLMKVFYSSIFDYVIGEGEYSLQEEAETYLKQLEERGGENTTDPYDRQQWFFYSAVQSYKMESDDWRYQSGLLNQWAEAASQDLPEAGTLKNLLDQNDYKKYYTSLIEENELSASPELAEVLNWGYKYCLENEIPPLAQDDWRYQKAMSAASAIYQLYSYDLKEKTTGIKTDPALYEETEKAIFLAEYQLEHNLEVNPADSFKSNPLVGTLLGNGTSTSRFWDAVASTGNNIVGIFMIIIAGSIVAGEFQKGTIKFLLLSPAKRWKILLAKYCTVLITGLCFMAIVWVANLFLSMIFYGAKDAFLPALSVVRKGDIFKVSRKSPYLLLLGRALLSTVKVVVTATLAFAVSSLFRNGVAAVGISVLVFYAGSTITSILLVFGQDWARYLIFANMDLIAVHDATTGFAHQSILTAAVVIVLHMIVFLWTAFDSFTRREI